MLTIDELMELVKDDCSRAKRNAEYDEQSKKQAIADLKAAQRHIDIMLFFNVDRNSFPKIKKCTRRQKTRHSYYHTWIADGFAVGMNKLFGIELEEGKEYTSKLVPWGVLELDGKDYPVYADDPGQCDYIVIDGQSISGGTYNSCPEGIFIHGIVNYYYDKTLEEIEGE